MYIHGDLQRVFDALYYMGMIDPVLQKNWQAEDFNKKQVHSAIKAVNTCVGNYKDLANELKTFDDHTLCLLAMQVAKEYVDFYCREKVH